jgi:hypothetical protein
MPRRPKNADPTIIAHRRQLVARLRLRLVSVRDIQRSLAGQFVNPLTGEPWSLGTVAGDLVVLQRAWRRVAAAEIAARQGELLAELREARRVAWAANDLDVVLRGIRQEADLLGLNAPRQIDLTVRVRALAAALGIDEATALAEAERIIREYKGGR